MKTAAELRQLVTRIDHKSYPAYKETRGVYQFTGYQLSIDHVQGDPFCIPVKSKYLYQRENSRISREVVLYQVAEDGIGRRADPTVWEMLREVWISGEGIRKEWDDRSQQMRTGSSGAERCAD